MGNYRIRLSDMIPNAWFYKLKDMNKSRKNQEKKIIYHHHRGDSKKKPNHTSSSSFSSSSSSSFSSSLSSKEKEQNLQGRQFSHQRKSYYFSRDLSTTTTSTAPEDEEIVKKIRSSGRNRGVVSSSVSAAGGCSCRRTIESVWSKPDSITTPDEYSSVSAIDNPCNYSHEILDDTMLSWSSSRTYCREKFQEKDIIIMDSIGKNQPLIAKEFQETAAGDKNHGFQFNLPPIITNHKKMESLEKNREPTKSCRNRSKFEERNSSDSVSVSVKDEKKKKKVIVSARRYSVNSSQGVKLRTNSPRIMNLRNIQGKKSLSSTCTNSRSRKSISDSFAVVKSSKDPKRDFRDSMVEMIMENNLRASKDLEDLLACYLSLNSDEYHDLIITVFKQIWFDIIDIHSPN